MEKLGTHTSTESTPATSLVAAVYASYGSISVTETLTRTTRSSSDIEDAMTLSKVRDILTPRLLTALFNYGLFSIVQTAYLCRYLHNRVMIPDTDDSLPFK